VSVVRGKSRRDADVGPAQSGHRRLSLQRRPLRVERGSYERLLLPSQQVPEEFRQHVPDFLLFADSAFLITNGTLKYYLSRDFAKRGFWVESDSPIVFVYEGNRNVIGMLGTLDRLQDWPMTKDAGWGPSIHCYVATKVFWYAFDGGLPQNWEVPGASAAQSHFTSLGAAGPRRSAGPERP
jgi:hypothetical protein